MATSSEPSRALMYGTARSSDSSRVVFVTGAGRSGTSTVSGSLKYLGLHVPQPEVPANRANPRGYFESQWVVDFHRQLLERAGVATLDADPEAGARTLTALAEPATRETMASWLAEATRECRQAVVKDPRTVWALDAWSEVASVCGVEAGYLSMMRHPAEVVGSRAEHYSKRTDVARQRRAEVRNLAGWVNVNLRNERSTRGHPRVFVRYDDLVGDWRSSLDGVRRRLGLEFDADLTGPGPHAIDDFIDPGLRRVHTSWDDLDVPHDLRAVAEGVWEATGELADPDGNEPDALRRLDELAERYGRLYEDSVAITATRTRTLVRSARDRRPARDREHPARPVWRRAAGRARRALRSRRRG